MSGAAPADSASAETQQPHEQVVVGRVTRAQMAHAFAAPSKTNEADGQSNDKPVETANAKPAEQKVGLVTRKKMSHVLADEGEGFTFEELMAFSASRSGTGKPTMPPGQ